MKLKIDGYKRQDLDAKRTICNEMYIDVEWFSDQIFTHQNCTLCNAKYYYVLDENNDIKCNISVDRLNNDIGHEKQNCHLLCIECNKSKR